MNAAFDGMAVTSFQQAIGDVFARFDTHYSSWDDKSLHDLKGTICSPISREMFAVHGDRRERRSLFVLLSRSARMEVSRGQDRLYALMHLAKDYKEGRITVDYNKTAEQVMADAAAYHISQHQSLNFLIVSYRDDETSNPTWIPEMWMGNHPAGRTIIRQKTDVLMHTKCSLNSVDMRSMRLRIRGVKAYWVRQCLVPNARKTVADFWRSQIGEYIQPYLGDTSIGLPLDFFRAIRGGMKDQTHEHQSIQTGLSHLWKIGNAPEHASRDLGYGGSKVLDLLDPLKNDNQPAWSALRDVLKCLHSRLCIKTNTKHLGLIPRCNVRKEDEIWLVLGCILPVVVRSQPNGRYQHICTAWIPALQQHEDIAQFVSEIQPGDKVGEWTVEDIELG